MVEKAQASTRQNLKEMIEATLKMLPVSREPIDEAYLENNKLILVEDFEVEQDTELRELIMDYRPRPAKA